MREAEAAALLGLTVPELLELASDGLIPRAVLDRDGWRFERKDLEHLRVNGIPRPRDSDQTGAA